MEAYLHFGIGEPSSPRLTEKVEIKVVKLWWQEQGLTFTKSGYGSRIPTQYMIKYCGHWRRVYCRIFSNNGTLYVGKKDNKVVVTIFGG